MKCGYLIAIGFMLIGAGAKAQTFSFVLCPDTDKHVTVSPDGDHFIVHSHIRISDCSDKRVFARVRCQLPDGSETDESDYSVTRLVKPRSDNDVWSFYLQIPRFSKAAQQAALIYQVEFGVHDPSELNDYSVFSSFTWRLTPHRRGWEMHKEDTCIPDMARTYEITGGTVRFRYGQSFACCEPSLVGPGEIRPFPPRRRPRGRWKNPRRSGGKIARVMGSIRPNRSHAA